MAVQDRLDLAELDPVAAALDLRVTTPAKCQTPAASRAARSPVQ
jgi:hypothetical protein